MLIVGLDGCLFLTVDFDLVAKDVLKVRAVAVWDEFEGDCTVVDHGIVPQEVTLLLRPQTYLNIRHQHSVIIGVVSNHKGYLFLF